MAPMDAAAVGTDQGMIPVEPTPATREDDAMAEIDLWQLQMGDVIALHDGSRARVKMPSADGQWILVEYLVSDDAEVGGDDLVSEDEIADVETPAPDTLE
jgi:hypothetical protein